jgi:hypothetical protein
MNLMRDIVSETINEKFNQKNQIHLKWEGSKNANIMELTPTERGTTGELILERHISNISHLESEEPETRKGDYDVLGHNTMTDNYATFEVKTATEDQGGGFQFNGMKKDAEYDYLFCLGISPNDEYFLVIHKDDLFNKEWMKENVGRKLGSLYKKKENGTDTYKLSMGKHNLRPISELPEYLYELI